MKPTHLSLHPSFTTTTSISKNDQLSWIMCDLLAKITKPLISLQINTNVDRHTTPTPDTLKTLERKYAQTL